MARNSVNTEYRTLLKIRSRRSRSLALTNQTIIILEELEKKNYIIPTQRIGRPLI
jgi:hypothetical protein